MYFVRYTLWVDNRAKLYCIAYCTPHCYLHFTPWMPMGSRTNYIYTLQVLLPQLHTTSINTFGVEYRELLVSTSTQQLSKTKSIVTLVLVLDKKRRYTTIYFLQQQLIFIMMESYVVKRCQQHVHDRKTLSSHFRTIRSLIFSLCFFLAMGVSLYWAVPVTIFAITAYYTSNRIIHDPNHPKYDLINPFISMIRTIKDDSDKENVPTADGPNRTLVMMWGNARGGERAWKSFYENVLDVNNADLALMVGDTDEFYQNVSLFDRAKYHWQFNEYDDWAEPITLLNHNSSSWQDRIYPYILSDSGILGGVKHANFYGSGAIALVVRYYLYSAIKQYKLDEKYDRFIITRTDHYYSCPHDISELQPAEHVFIPQGEDYFGICDRHTVLHSSNVASVLDVLRPLIAFPEEYSIPLGFYPSGPEQILYRTMTRMHQIHPSMIHRFPRVMFTCGDASHQDMSRYIFRPDSNHLVYPEFVRYKYYAEYRGSKKTCRTKKSNYWTSSFLFS
jgi:hypothetical protein